VIANLLKSQLAAVYILSAVCTQISVSMYVIQRGSAQMKRVKCIVLGGVVQHYITRRDTLHTPCGWHSDAETCSSAIFVMKCIL
jgi:hypothetical protein